MGRPRKRRREGDDEETAAPFPNVNNSPTRANGSFTFTDFGIITPPQLHDPTLLGDVTLNEHGPTLQHHLGDFVDFGISPISNIEYV
jgi:hypothetical protein